MRARRAHRACIALGVGGVAVGAVACGARTALFTLSQDVSTPAPSDAGAEVTREPEASTPIDAHVPDAPAGKDAPSVEGDTGPDASLLCPGGAPPTAYLLAFPTGTIYTFDPSTLEVALVGTPLCAGQPLPGTNFTVSLEGVVYATDEGYSTIYAVDLKTLACTVTPFPEDALGLLYGFGMAVSRDAAGERLLVYGNPIDSAQLNNPILVAVDLATFAVTQIGPATPRPPTNDANFQATADLQGHLFASGEGTDAGSLIVEVDTATAAVVGVADNGPVGIPMAYGNQLYLFFSSGVMSLDFATMTTQYLGQLALGAQAIDVEAASALPCQGGP